MNKQYNPQQKKGFTLIEAVVVVGVFTVIIVMFAQTMMTSSAVIAQTRIRMMAVSLANEQMERLRNLPYDSVATIGGIPSGDIDPDFTRIISNKEFHVQIDIRYIDDEDDDTITSSPPDTVPNDYKRVQIDITWGNSSPAQHVMIASYFIPPGMETTAGGGTLVINIFDNQGQSVNNTLVGVTNTTIVPNIDISVFTGIDGRVVIPGAPAGDHYAIHVSKSGYEIVDTYPPYPETSFTPTDQHATVINGSLSTKSLVSGILSNLQVTVIDPFENSLEDIPIKFIGGRQLGVDTSSNPVFNFDQSHTSNSSGVIDISNLSPGVYTTSTESTNYQLFRVVDNSTIDEKTFSLAQGVTKDIDIVMANKMIPSMIIHITDSSTGTPIENATVQVRNILLNYDETKSTAQYGETFFPKDEENGLVSNTEYELTVSADGYQETTQSETVQQLENITISLNPE